MMLRGIVSLVFTLSVAGAFTPPPAPLPFYYDLYTFRGDGDQTRVVASIAVEAGRLEREHNRDGSLYRFDVRFVLADTAERAVSNSEDSVYVSTRRPLSPGHLLHTYVEVDAPPSDATVQRVVVTDASRPGTGQLYTSPFVIPDYTGGDLMLSDVAFGLPDASEGWPRRGVTVALLPTSQFPEAAFDVYYEIYNLPSGHRYETEISVAPLDDAGREGATVRTLFSGDAAPGPDGTVAELRRVESSLEEGRYLFTVAVTDLVTGQIARRTRTVRVRGWRSGATLVPAMPYGGDALAER